MDLHLTGKRALVAGSSGGIGAGIARMLAEEGVTVVVHGRNGGSADRVAQQIRDGGGQAAVVLGDLSDARAVERIAREAEAQFGGIDILVNSAGASPAYEPWLETSPDLWEERFRSTTLYAVRLIHALTPAMKTRGWGRIISIGSGVYARPSAFAPEYSAAKAALHTLAVGLAHALGDSGVTANTVTSSVVLTPNTADVMAMQAARLGWPETGAALEARVAKEMWPMPIGRLGRVEDVAAAVCFLCSAQARHITGANLRVDGGSAGWVD